MSSKVKIIVKPGADNFASPGERIIEFYHPTIGGGLISFAVDEEAGTIKVLVYRHDVTVSVSESTELR